ncbi:MAG: C-GCAxxG-C-C family protein [Desulfitobacteriaceae bacterium]|nr:C-GCAxxG-C-C family protein [Desulfitobacteriaceae bacterium]
MDNNCLEGRKKEEVLEEVYQKGFEYEKNYGNCCQSVIAAITDIFGIDKSMVKSGFLFAGGFGLGGKGTCGALAGAAIVLSSCYGRDREGFDQKISYGKLYRKINALQQKFEEEFSSSLCSEVQRKIMGRSFNLLNKADYKEFEKAGGHQDKCTNVVGITAMWLAEILWDEQHQ